MPEKLPRPIHGGYLLLEVIGKGGMGVVYKAVHTVLEREVAVKVLHPNLTSDPLIERRFLREARSIGRIKNPHVVEVLNFGKTEEGELYLVMELIEGVILSKALQSEPYLPPERACHIARQMARALGAAHEQGIVHRDLKPANIILVQQEDNPDFVKLLDFGVAKILNESENTLTRDGLIVGTYSTMAPEQLLGYDVDGRSDLYSLGVVLYTMLAGRPPFRGRDLASLCYQHVHVSPPTPASANPDSPISPALNACVMRALCKTPDFRYKDMQEFQDALAQALAAPDEVPAQTQEALANDAKTVPPSTATELAILAQTHGKIPVGLSEEPTAPSGHVPADAAFGATVSLRSTPPVAASEKADRRTLYVVGTVIVACAALLAFGLFQYGMQTTAPATSVLPAPKPVAPQPPPVAAPAPAVAMPDSGPAAVVPEAPTKNPAMGRPRPAPEPAKKLKKKRRPRVKGRKTFRKPDLIRVHTEPSGPKPEVK